MTAPSALDQHQPQQNALIAALSATECERLGKDLELVPLALGQVLYESGQTMSHAYFPIDCIVSLLYVMKNGESAEIAVVGNEGMIGLALFMGGESVPHVTPSGDVRPLQVGGTTWRNVGGDTLSASPRGRAPRRCRWDGRHCGTMHLIRCSGRIVGGTELLGLLQRTKAAKA